MKTMITLSIALGLAVTAASSASAQSQATMNANAAQASAISQISAAIGSMDQATQQNAAMVEEQTAASHSLAAEAAKLMELLARFNLGMAAQAGMSTQGGRRAA